MRKPNPEEIDDDEDNKIILLQAHTPKINRRHQFSFHLENPSPNGEGIFK